MPEYIVRRPGLWEQRGDWWYAECHGNRSGELCMEIVHASDEEVRRRGSMQCASCGAVLKFPETENRKRELPLAGDPYVNPYCPEVDW